MSARRRQFENHATGGRSSRGDNGFSLIELVVAMAVIAVLVAIAVPAITKSRQAARRTQCMNNMRQIAAGLLEVANDRNRFPACGNFGLRGNHHSWVVDLLPWIDQRNISDRWDKNRPISDPVNAPLAQTHIPVLTCPMDISVQTRPGETHGDLSYVVNGGIGFTVLYPGGMHDCPVDPSRHRLDLNQNGVLCPQPPDLDDDGEPSDRELFFRMGLFFNETWDLDVTNRHHSPATVIDGMSQTMLLSENVRTGYNPDRPETGWASPNPYLTSFYIGNPCLDGSCTAGVVDYSRSNAGVARINAGLTSEEGSSPYPSSFHAGGVHVAFCDGRVVFLSEEVDGGVYAALASPQGVRLNGTPLAQSIVSDSSF